MSVLFEPTRIKTMKLTNRFVRSATADNRAECGCATESQGRGLAKQEFACCW